MKKCMSAGNFKEMKHDMYKKAKQQDFVAPGGRYSVQLWDVNNDSAFVVQLWFGGLLLFSDGWNRYKVNNNKIFPEIK